MHSQWALFQQLCRILGGANPGALHLATENGQWPQLIGLAAAHSVLPTLASRFLDAADVAPAAETVIRDELVASLRKNTQRNMHLLMQARSVSRELNNAGITPLFLKGTALLLTTHGNNPGYRYQSDIDLLVPPDQLRSAWEALTGAGWHCPPSPGKAGGLSGDFVSARHIARHHHHLPALVHTEYAAPLELHTHHLPREFQEDNPVEELFDCAVSNRLGEAAFLVPSGQHQLIQILLGTWLHDGFATRCVLPLRQADDLLHIVQCGGPGDGRQDQAYELVRRRCSQRALRFAEYVSALMCTPLPQLGVASAPPASHPSLMSHRLDHPLLGAGLDRWWRISHLGAALMHSPGKLPGYLRQRFNPSQ